MVLTPESDSNLPIDARIECDGKEYYRNRKGNYIIPIGTVLMEKRL